MGQVIEFPTERVRFYAQLESRLERSLKHLHPELAQEIKCRLIDKTKELEAKSPAFKIELPEGSSLEIAEDLYRQFKQASDTIGEFAIAILLLEMELIIARARNRTERC